MEGTSSEVIVIGAGAAGLAAARELAQAERSVVVLEARERLGGRMWTTRAQGMAEPIEFGAAFVHGGNPSLWNLVRDAGLQVVAAPDRHWLIRGGRRARLPDIWDRIDRGLRRIGPRCHGDFGTWLRRHESTLDPLDRVLVREYVAGFHAAPLDAMSAATLYRSTQFPPENQFRLAHGFQGLVEALHRALPVARVALRLGDPVEHVRWSTRGVKVSTRDGATHAARAVIVTVPLGVLQARAPAPGAINFEPELRAERTLWDRLKFGHAVRIVLQLQTDIWKRPPIPEDLRADDGRAFGFLHATKGAFPVWWSSAPAPLITGWVGGPHAWALAGRPDHEIFRHALYSLAAHLRCTEAELAEAIVAWHLHNWSADPYARGAYTFSQAGFEDAPAQLARPVRDTIFFAGEATADAQEIGTVHGALVSGQRAARAVLNCLRPTAAPARRRRRITAAVS